MLIVKEIKNLSAGCQISWHDKTILLHDWDNHFIVIGLEGVNL